MRCYKQIFLYVWLCALCLLGGGLLAGQDSGRQSGLFTLAVRPISTQEFSLSPESKTLLQERVAAQFSHVGGFKRVSVQGSSREFDSGTDIILSTEIQNYRIEADQNLGYIVRLKILLTLESGRGRLNGLPYRIEVAAIGHGSSSFAAESRAIGDISNDFRRALLKSPVVGRPAAQQASPHTDQQKTSQAARQAAALRISDTLAGRVVLNQGGKAGILRGAEYGPAHSDGGLIKVAAVYPEFAEGHIVFGRDALAIGTLMEQRGQGRLRTALEGTYFYRSGTTDSPAEHLGGLSARLYYDRDLFSVSPLIKADLLSNRVGFLQAGVALNWYAGRFTVEPALLGGVGFSGLPLFALFSADTSDSTDESGSLYWGGSVELGWTMRLNRTWLFLLDIGMSGWYYTADATKEVSFMYVGSGFILKY
ncbi:MAG: hypothetical protein K9M94_13600 [Spirochaetia bacterium]|nr:hypothetical protein [Spirochaetia bacterium]